MERIVEALTNQKLSCEVELEQADIHGDLDKYVVEPLTPNLSNKMIPDNGHEKMKEDLLTRLRTTFKKLRQYEKMEDERDLNKNQNIPCLDTCGILSQKDSLPRNVEENINNIVESTQEYIEKLNCQLMDLDDADRQVSHALFLRASGFVKVPAYFYTCVQ